MSTGCLLGDVFEGKDVIGCLAVEIAIDESYGFFRGQVFLILFGLLEDLVDEVLVAVESVDEFL